MDYQKEYDEYWSRPDRWGSHSFRDPNLIADQICAVCGTGKILDAGFGMGLLVKTLLQRGIDAHGMDIAERVVAEANQFAPGRFTVGSLLGMPFADDAFETVVSTDCLEHIAEADVPKALSELYRVTSRHLFIQLATTPDRDKRWHLTVRDRAWWEQQFFMAGFRKHPATQIILPYESLEQNNWQITLLFEKIPSNVLEKFPLSSLKAERDLHMDMLREFGRRSDAHIARYMLARRFLPKPGLVLDAACGLGYGSSVLAHNNPNVRVIGMDASAFAVNYARANFAGIYPNVEFREGDVNDLSRIADGSVSLIASFETIEHLRQPELFLAEARRVLKPGGIFLSSVPNLWVDETGNDPNPHHFHVFDFAKLAGLTRKFFTLHEVYRQTAGGGMKLPKAPRQMRRVQLPVTAETERAEWWLVAGMKEKRFSAPASKGHSAPRRELVLLTSDPTHPMYTSWIVAWDGPWKAVNPAHADVNQVREAGLVVTHDVYCDPGRNLARKVFEAGIPTLILADGILEYRNTWEHPQLEPGAIFQPVLGHKIACIGRSQARILESWGNVGKCEITGSPRLDGYCELRRREKRADEPFRLLVMTALTPWFTEGQHQTVLASLRDLKNFFAQQQRIGGIGVQPVWRLTKGLDEELGIAKPKRMDFSGNELAAILQQVDAVITTPSTAMLEAMLLGLPVAALDYTNSPCYVEPAWRITARAHLPQVLSELTRRPAAKMLFQETMLHDALECATPATPRFVRLIREMMECAHRAREKGQPLVFPDRILEPEPGWHALQENRFDVEQLYPAKNDEPTNPQTSTPVKKRVFAKLFSHSPKAIPESNGKSTLKTHSGLNGAADPHHATQNPEHAITKPKILFVSHNASRSGAPIMLLNVIRAIREKADYDARIILRGGGPLESEFQQLGETIVCAGPELDAAWLDDVWLVYSNTCTNGTFLRSVGPPVLTHLHELPFAINSFGAENLELVKKQTTHFIACSEAVLQSFQERQCISPDAISLVYGGIPVSAVRKAALGRSAIEARRLCGFGQDDLVVAGCGFADWRKGPDLFVQLADQFRRRNLPRKFSFLWIGKLPEDAHGRILLHDIERLGLNDSLKFIGEQANPYPFLNACDVFCSCSREDPFPLVMLEAAALGKPTVCFENTGGAPEFCARGAGFAVPYMQLEAMGETLIQLAENKNLRDSTGRTGSRIVEEEFDLRNVMPRIVQLVEKFSRAPKHKPPAPRPTFVTRLKNFAKSLVGV